MPTTLIDSAIFEDIFSTDVSRFTRTLDPHLF